MVTAMRRSWLRAVLPGLCNFAQHLDVQQALKAFARTPVATFRSATHAETHVDLQSACCATSTAPPRRPRNAALLLSARPPPGAKRSFGPQATSLNVLGGKRGIPDFRPTTNERPRWLTPPAALPLCQGPPAASRPFALAAGLAHRVRCRQPRRPHQALASAAYCRAFSSASANAAARAVSRRLDGSEWANSGPDRRAASPASAGAFCTMVPAAPRSRIIADKPRWAT
jgi:hypothetical protein